MNRRVVSVLVVAGLVGGGVVAADLVPAPQRTQGLAAAGAVLPVSSATLVCPSVGADRRTGVTTVAVASAPAPPSRSAGSVTAQPLPTTGQAPHRLVQAAGVGAVVDLSDAHNRSAVVLASGGPAATLGAVQTTRTASGPGRGLSTARCVAPARDWWFAGPTGWLGTYGQVMLTNVESTVALVDIGLWGHDGQLNVPAAQGITVPPGSRVVVPLSQLIPDQANALLHVVAITGRVAAAVSDVRHSGSGPDGIDWVPATTAPDRDVVVPGLSAAAPIRKLVVGVPGADDATISVRVVGTSGSFVPTSLARLTVPGGTVRTIDLSKVLAAEDVAVEVKSDAPVVVAGLLYGRDASTGFGDVAWTAGVAALDGAGVVAETRVHRGNDTQIILSAPDGPATVVVSALAPPPPHQVTVQIAAGRTVTVDVASVLPANASSGAVAVEPQLGSGRVYAGRLVYEHGAHGPLFTMLPIWSGPSTADVPPVIADIGAPYESSR